MKQNLLLIFTFFALTSVGQNCKLIRQTSKKSAEIVSRGGSVMTKNFELLYIERNQDPANPNDSTNFSAMTIIGSRYELSDSVINSEGVFRFTLSNGQTLEMKGATASNLGDALMGAPNSIMFRVEGTYKQFKPLSEHLVERVEIFGILNSEFKSKEQKKLQTITTCLLSEQ